MDKNQILEFVKKQTLAVLSTVTPDSKSQSAVMAIAVTNNWQILMSTEAETRKVSNLKNNPSSSLIIGGLESTSIQLDGQTIITSGPEAESVKAQILAIHPDTKDYLTSTSVFLKFIPSWLRYSDFSQSSPVVVEINF